MSEVTDIKLSADAGSIKRERCTSIERRRAILSAATSVFLERGYAGATIDAVVERAGGSKASVYAQFGNKEKLLAALVSEAAEELAASVGDLSLDKPMDITLHDFGRRFLQLILQPKRLALYRLVVGESGRLCEMGDLFYRTGPETMVHRLAEFFHVQMQRGRIAMNEPDRLASYFIGAMRGDLHFRALFNPTRTPTLREIDQHLDFVISRFLDSFAAA
jgi:AcrR family transcriptional regulator